jgi:hypothetical protein
MTPERWRRIEELYHSARERGAGVTSVLDNSGAGRKRERHGFPCFVRPQKAIQPVSTSVGTLLGGYTGIRIV